MHLIFNVCNYLRFMRRKVAHLQSLISLLLLLFRACENVRTGPKSPQQTQMQMWCAFREYIK